MTFPILWLPAGEQNLYNSLNGLSSAVVLPFLILCLISAVVDANDGYQPKEARVFPAVAAFLYLLAIILAIILGILPFLIVGIVIWLLMYLVNTVACAFGKPLW